jgi:hypothetical protein
MTYFKILVWAFVKLNKWFEASALQTLRAAWYKYAMKSLKPLHIFIKPDNTAPSLCIFNAVTVQLLQ